MTLTPDALGPDDVAAARTGGLSEAAIRDALFVGGGFALIDRVADALDFFVPPDFRKGAPIIRKIGYQWLAGTWPRTSGLPRSGWARKAALVRRLEETVLRSPGTLEPSIREAIAEERDVPEAARAYVGKVHRHAYRVTDEDVAGLRSAGWSEDQIFEATVAAALGAARKRLRAGLAALEGSAAGARAASG